MIHWNQSAQSSSKVFFIAMPEKCFSLPAAARLEIATLKGLNKRQLHEH
jgi:hypothetical protein